MVWNCWSQVGEGAQCTSKLVAGVLVHLKQPIIDSSNLDNSDKHSLFARNWKQSLFFKAFISQKFCNCLKLSSDGMRLKPLHYCEAKANSLKSPSAWTFCSGLPQDPGRPRLMCLLKAKKSKNWRPREREKNWLLKQRSLRILCFLINGRWQKIKS